LLHRFVVAISLAASVFLASVSISSSFTNEKEPYVYVQTFPEIETLTKPLLEMARKDPPIITCMAKSCWTATIRYRGCSATLRRSVHKKRNHRGSDTDFVVAQKNEMEKIESGLVGEYYKRTFRLRDSQDECVVYFRRKTFEGWFQGAPPLFQGKP
jgi:hypothetical protein